MKKLLSILLALCMILGLMAGCGSQTASSAPAETGEDSPRRKMKAARRNPAFSRSRAQSSASAPADRSARSRPILLMCNISNVWYNWDMLHKIRS